MAFTDILTKYIEKLQIEGDLAVGYIEGNEKFDEFKDALRKFGFAFTTRSSRKENYSFEVGPTGKKRRLPGRGSLMFKSSSDVSVSFFGQPFVVETTVYYNCSQGLKYYASKRYPDEMFKEGDPLAKRRRRPKVTQKIGCEARMTVKKIKVFVGPDYYVAKDNWREKKAAIDQLRTDLEGSVRVEHIVRYCLLLSMDKTHNHPPVAKAPPKVKKTMLCPAKRVLKLHEQIKELLPVLDSELVTKCTNIQTLMDSRNSLRTIIDSLKDSIEKNTGVPEDQILLAKEKSHKLLKCCIIAEKRERRQRRPSVKVEVMEEQPVEVQEKLEVLDFTSEEPSIIENSENSQIIELPSGVFDGTQVIWDPVNVSWIPDGQSLILQQETGGTQRQIKPNILLQRRVEDGSNIGVLSQVGGGQNYTILQHSSIPNVGVSVPFTVAKMVPQGALLKPLKRTDVGSIAIAIPTSMDCGQPNWTQSVVVSDQFPTVPSQTMWNVPQ